MRHAPRRLLCGARFLTSSAGVAAAIALAALRMVLLREVVQAHREPRRLRRFRHIFRCGAGRAGEGRHAHAASDKRASFNQRYRHAPMAMRRGAAGAVGTQQRSRRTPPHSLLALAHLTRYGADGRTPPMAGHAPARALTAPNTFRFNLDMCMGQGGCGLSVNWCWSAVRQRAGRFELSGGC